MGDSPYKDKTSAPDRRKFLKSVAGAGIAALIAQRTDAEPAKSNPLLEAYHWSQQEINQLYQELDKTVDAFFEKARTDGKKAVLVIGDDHNGAKGLLIDMMLLRIISTKKSTQRLYLEMSPKDYGVVHKDLVASMQTFGQDAIHQLGLLLSAQRWKLQPYPIEDNKLHEESARGMREIIDRLGNEASKKPVGEHLARYILPREQAMLTNIRETGTLSCGYTHTQGMIEGLQAKGFATLGVNLPRFSPFTPYRPAFTQARIDYADGKAVRQLSLPTGKDFNIIGMPAPYRMAFIADMHQCVDEAVLAQQKTQGKGR